jgi:hypothetical protein
MEALLELANNESISDAKRRVTWIVRRQALLSPFHEEYYASYYQTAYKRQQQKHASHGEHPDDEIQADVGRWLRRFANIDDDRLFLQ